MISIMTTRTFTTHVIAIAVTIFMLFMTTGCQKPDKAITCLDDAKAAKIGVMTGSTSEIVARELFPDAQIKNFDEFMDAVVAMKAGQLDAVVLALPIAIKVEKLNPEFSHLQEPLNSEEIAIALRKGEDKLLADLNRFIAELKADGSLASMNKRWIEAALDPYEELTLTLPTTGKLLKVGVSATREPFSFVDKNGSVTGHDGDLARIISIKLKRPIQFSNMPFTALIPALQSGKIDLIITGMTATDERRKSVDFTQPYYIDAQVLMMKKAIASSSAEKQVVGRSEPLSDSQTASPATPKIAVPAFFKGVGDSFYSNIIHEKRYLLLLDGLKTTVVISILATVFGTLLGALICFMRMSKYALLSRAARIYISILRGTPVLVLLMLIFYVVFASINISPVIVAVIAFGMNFGAYTAEIFRTGIEGVEIGQTEAGVSLGFTKVGAFTHIVLPQMVRRILPVYKGEFISLVKMTSIVGYIAVQDLTKASDIIRSRTFDAFFPLVMVAVLYFLISWILMQGLDYLERATDPKAKRLKVGRS